MTNTERIANKVYDKYFPPKSKEVPWERYYQALWEYKTFLQQKGGRS